MKLQFKSKWAGSWMTFILALAALACGESTTPTLQPTDAPIAFEGRLLFLQSMNSIGTDLQMVELRSGLSAPEVVCDGLPGFLSRDEENEPVLSPDRTRILLPSHQVIDISGCGSVDLPFPVELGDQNPQKILATAFSPDGKYIAYSLRGLEPDLRTSSGARWTQSGLYLFDLESGALSTVLLGPCATYMGQGRLCGEFGSPFWLDANTLGVSHYSGELPDQVSFPGYQELWPNHWSYFKIERVDVDRLTFSETEGEPPATNDDLSDVQQVIRSPDGRFVASLLTITGFKVYIHDTETGHNELLIDLSKVNNNSRWWLIGWYP